MKKYKIEPGEVLEGSSSLYTNTRRVEKTDYQTKNMAKNKVISYLMEKGKTREAVIKEQIERYRKYRRDWKAQPKNCINNKWSVEELKENKVLPLCVDIETAAICDLACPFCSRQYIATPDKLIDSDLCYEMIDQASSLGVPSIKFNLRGEPLLHPELPEFISYAKSKGILETGINTNATMLTEKKSRELIESGLDLLIFSFDGGTKETYEKMRPGRFKENKFEKVYNNIVRFSEIRKEMNSVFPFTKIQMIMTKETYFEKEKFFELFNSCVDDVTVSQYQERGGDLELASELFDNKKKDELDGVYFHNGQIRTRVDADEIVYRAIGRKPCEQLFQRLTVTYEGRVGMCCIDWGASHAVGYVHKLALINFSEYNRVLKRAQKNKKGYELLPNLTIGGEFDVSEGQPILSLEEIWCGEEIQKVRESHYKNALGEVEVCANCTYTDTFVWRKVKGQEVDDVMF